MSPAPQYGYTPAHNSYAQIRSQKQAIAYKKLTMETYDVVATLVFEGTAAKALPVSLMTFRHLLSELIITSIGQKIQEGVVEIDAQSTGTHLRQIVFQALYKTWMMKGRGFTFSVNDTTLRDTKLKLDLVAKYPNEAALYERFTSIVKGVVKFKASTPRKLTLEVEHSVSLAALGHWEESTDAVSFKPFPKNNDLLTSFL
jgi:hypothetical protein